VTAEGDRRDALEALDRLVDRGGDADDVLRDALAILARLYPWAAIRFVEDGELVPGPSVGSVDAESGHTAQILFRGMKVGELTAAAEVDHAAFLAGFADRISPYCLVGWDTGGESWEP
jgi:hypothetical protein